ncbi:GNAT family N-acetyltransferase [bacterium]|nr:GNAT family N-acetyltransferase [bacterium]
MKVRASNPDDHAELWQLFHDTIHCVNSQDYSPEQIEVWAPDEVEMSRWASRMEGIQPWVAIEGEQIVGFADVQATGLVDMFYVHHAWQRKGVGRVLMDKLHIEAQKLNLTELHSHVSLTARPFFEAFRFVVEKAQEVTIQGVALRNFVMRKTLD